MELGYVDLTLDTGPANSLVGAFSQSVPADAAARWPRWRDIGSLLVDQYDGLRDAGLSNTDRAAWFEDLQTEARGLGCEKFWCQPGAP